MKGMVEKRPLNTDEEAIFRAAAASAVVLSTVEGNWSWMTNKFCVKGAIVSWSIRIAGAISLKMVLAVNRRIARLCLPVPGESCILSTEQLIPEIGRAFHVQRQASWNPRFFTSSIPRSRYRY